MQWNTKWEHAIKLLGYEHGAADMNVKHYAKLLARKLRPIVEEEGDPDLRALVFDLHKVAKSGSVAKLKKLVDEINEWGHTGDWLNVRGTE